MIRASRFLAGVAAFFVAAGSAAAQYPQPMAGPPMSYTQPAPNVLNYNVGRHKPSWDERQPIEQFLIQMGQRSWIRFEYMQMEIERPGNETIGAPVTDFLGPAATAGQHVNGTRQVVDPITGTDFGFSVIPSLNNLTLDEVPGIRGTYGISFNGGSAEFSVFGTEQVSDGFRSGDLQAGRQPDPADLAPLSPALGTETDPNFIIPLGSDGVTPAIPAAGEITDLAVLGFDSSYQNSVRSQMWGAELNILSQAMQQTDQLQWQWLGGFRYVSFDESFGQVGVRDDGGNIAPITTRIRSSVSNNMYGPTVGFRMSLASKYLTLSATPRVTFALNDYTSRLNAVGEFPGTPTISETEEIDFTTLTQVSLLAEAHLTESFSLFGGYDFMWSYRLARPFRGISYDSTTPVGGTREARLGLDPDPESMFMQGFTFGATLRF